MPTESMYASAIGVTRLVAPGPEVAMQTPTRPVASATTARALAAEVSTRAGPPAGAGRCARVSGVGLLICGLCWVEWGPGVRALKNPACQTHGGQRTL